MTADIIILRHAQTSINSTIPVTEWNITNRGMQDAQSIADTGVFDNVLSIYSSPEKKALSTAHTFAKRLGLDVITKSGLAELDRGSEFHESKEHYIRCVNSVLSFPPEQVEGWESTQHALERFSQTIENIELEEEYSLIVSHGIVMSLYFAECQNIREKSFQRWMNLPFLAWGKISQGKVLKDIVY
ncbi:MAG: histidine phosphatase family protein [Candidatus Thorarchaeota archaeon]